VGGRLRCELSARAGIENGAAGARDGHLSEKASALAIASLSKVSSRRPLRHELYVIANTVLLNGHYSCLHLYPLSLQAAGAPGGSHVVAVASASGGVIAYDASTGDIKWRTADCNEGWA
jgi:hypothetical protein